MESQEQRQDIYASMSFDYWISLAIDELYAKKTISQAKRLTNAAKPGCPTADINTLVLASPGLSKNQMITLEPESCLIEAHIIIINVYTGVGNYNLATQTGQASVSWSAGICSTSFCLPWNVGVKRQQKL